jgi:hypothetical protein
MTIVVLIGNSDNKLSQQDWAKYICEVKKLVSIYSQTIFFSGGSSYDEPRQNACFVFDCDESTVEVLKEQLAVVRVQFNQEAAAVVTGVTKFV